MSLWGILVGFWRPREEGPLTHGNWYSHVAPCAFLANDEAEASSFPARARRGHCVCVRQRTIHSGGEGEMVRSEFDVRVGDLSIITHQNQPARSVYGPRQPNQTVFQCKSEDVHAQSRGQGGQERKRTPSNAE